MVDPVGVLYNGRITLDADHKEQKWEGTATENTIDCTVTTHTLSVRQVVLGPDAKDEANVVELEVMGFNDKKQRIPIYVSKAGASCVANVEVLVEDQAATFHLVRGGGPVHLSGTHQTETNVIEDDDIEELAEDEDEEEDEVVEDSPNDKNGMRVKNEVFE
ncbi:Nucleophosmin [Chionoecetes opilio]|uniref:Nucleophosmin n=1 Tax=Chionoecetes opilio TaxID=41210 RepID=A0A8J5D597_CHIOP|nr:Nucleophosmin [Chionoecetes opilio]